MGLVEFELLRQVTERESLGAGPELLDAEIRLAQGRFVSGHEFIRAVATFRSRNGCCNKAPPHCRRRARSSWCWSEALL